MFITVLHLLIFLFNTYTLWYDQMYLDFPLPSLRYLELPFKGRLMFFTMWGFILQTVYFGFALLNDLLGTSEATPKKSPIVRVIKDTVFSVSFPIAMYVSLAFWGLYYFDKELVFPDIVEKHFPVWLNHTLHTFIIVFMLVELVLTNRNYPSRIVGMALTTTFSIAYITWLHVLYDRTGAWAYPIFDVLNFPQRIIYLTISTSVGLGFYLVGEKLNSFVCPDGKKTYVKPKRK